jgi:hypothetical protein
VRGQSKSRLSRIFYLGMDKSRRRFFGDIAKSAGGAALIGLGLGMCAKKSVSLPAAALRPPGALEPGLTNIDDAQMGVAVLVDQENCLNFLGLRCDVCYRVCPLIDEAITIERQHNVRSAWEEKRRAGESLVPGDPQHEYHLPEGLDYENDGEGLIREGLPDTPFPKDPLETLNREASQ